MNSLGTLFGYYLYDQELFVEETAKTYKRLMGTIKATTKGITDEDLAQLHLSFVLGALTISVTPEQLEDKERVQELVTDRAKEITELVLA